MEVARTKALLRGPGQIARFDEVGVLPHPAERVLAEAKACGAEESLVSWRFLKQRLHRLERERHGIADEFRIVIRPVARSRIRQRAPDRSRGQGLNGTTGKGQREHEDSRPPVPTPRETEQRGGHDDAHDGRVEEDGDGEAEAQHLDEKEIPEGEGCEDATMMAAALVITPPVAPRPRRCRGGIGPARSASAGSTRNTS